MVTSRIKQLSEEGVALRLHFRWVPILPVSLVVNIANSTNNILYVSRKLTLFLETYGRILSVLRFCCLVEVRCGNICRFSRLKPGFLLLQLHLKLTNSHHTIRLWVTIGFAHSSTGKPVVFCLRLHQKGNVPNPE